MYSALYCHIGIANVCISYQLQLGPLTARQLRLARFLFYFFCSTKTITWMVDLNDGSFLSEVQPGKKWMIIKTRSSKNVSCLFYLINNSEARKELQQCTEKPRKSMVWRSFQGFDKMSPFLASSVNFLKNNVFIPTFFNVF